MSIDTMTWDNLSEYAGRHVIVFGTDQNGTALVEFARAKHPSVAIDFLLDFSCPREHLGLPVLTLEQARERNLLEGATIIIAHANPMGALNQLLDDAPAEIRLASRQLHAIFHAGSVPSPPH